MLTCGFPTHWHAPLSVCQVYVAMSLKADLIQRRKHNLHAKDSRQLRETPGAWSTKELSPLSWVLVSARPIHNSNQKKNERQRRRRRWEEKKAEEGK